MEVKKEDIITLPNPHLREKSKKQNRIVEALQLAAQVGMPAWVEVNGDKAEAAREAAGVETIHRLPSKQFL